jgi:hypothetical protein
VVAPASCRRFLLHSLKIALNSLNPQFLCDQDSAMSAERTIPEFRQDHFGVRRCCAAFEPFHPLTVLTA